MRSSKYRDSEKPDLQFAFGYPSESDKLRLCNGTVLQRDVTKRERRRLERERTREKELTSKSSKITSSSNAMDTDEAGKHTQNILARVNRQQEDDKLATRLVEISSTKEPEHSTEDTQEDSDLDTTVLDNLKIPGRFSDDLMVKEGLGEPLGEIDADLQRMQDLIFCIRRSLMAVQHSTGRRTLCQGSLLHSHSSPGLGTSTSGITSLEDRLGQSW